jgi:hypothetical protein
MLRRTFSSLKFPNIIEETMHICDLWCIITDKGVQDLFQISYNLSLFKRYVLYKGFFSWRHKKYKRGVSILFRNSRIIKSLKSIYWQDFRLFIIRQFVVFSWSKCPKRRADETKRLASKTTSTEDNWLESEPTSRSCSNWWLFPNFRWSKFSI